MKALLLGATIAFGVTTLAQAQAKSSVPMTKYTDAENGVSLEYPSVWKRVTGPEAYCKSMEFSDGVRAKIPVHFGVQFTGKGNFYEKTSLQALVFLFGTRKNISEEACEAIAKNFPQDEHLHPPDEGVPLHFDYGRGGECGLNNNIDAQVFTRFSGDRCYVFEEDFDSMGGAPDGMRDLTDSEKKALQRHLDSIMQSVQIESVMLPRSWKTTTYRDAGTGVSFEYPAALHEAKDVDSYFPTALTQMQGISFHAKLAYSSVPVPKVDEATTDLDTLTFLFATKHIASAKDCYALTEGLDDAGGDAATPKIVTIGSVLFHVGSVSGAGLSHGINGKIYAAYRSRTCFLFEQDVSSLSGYAGDVTAAQWKDIYAHMDAIASTIRFSDAPK